MQPDVLPGTQRHGIAEPLVRQLVGDQPDRVPVVDHEVATERRQPLRLQRDLEVVIGDDAGVRRKRVRPEHLARSTPSSRAAPRTPRRTPPGLPGRGVTRVIGTRASTWAHVVLPDLHRGEVRRHRHRLLEGPDRVAAAAKFRGELTGHGDVIVRGCGHDDGVRRLVVRAVVAREPRRSAVRLGCHDHAVGEFLPARRAQGSRSDRLRGCRRTSP